MIDQLHRGEKMDNQCIFCGNNINVQYEVVCPVCNYDHLNKRFTDDDRSVD